MKRKKEEIEVLAPQKGSQELAMNTKADVIIYGGAAKLITGRYKLL